MRGKRRFSQSEQTKKRDAFGRAWHDDKYQRPAQSLMTTTLKTTTTAAAAARTAQPEQEPERTTVRRCGRVSARAFPTVYIEVQYSARFSRLEAYAMIVTAGRGYSAEFDIERG